MGELLVGSGARLELIQLTEKLGKLRFYYRLHGASEARTAAVFGCYEEAVKRSAETCIDCGGPGQIRADRNWKLPLCDKHL